MPPGSGHPKRDYQAKIAELQVRDSLTGLYNRKHFIRITSAELKKEREGLVQALLYIRPDHFSLIDERFGPVGSDVVLRSMGALIEEQAGKRCAVARFGGIIFTVLVVRRSFSEICTLAENLVSSIASTVFSAGPLSTSMTASVGLVELSELIADSTQAFSLAQAAAKQAREKGGNQLQINQSLEVDDEGHLQDAGWARKIRTALEDDIFHLVYQPIASLMGAENNSYDVLVRMLDPGRDEILPGAFMPAATRTGLMPAIDRWIIERAFAKSSQREAQGKPCLLFLRVSENSLRDEEFCAWLVARQKRHAIAANAIVLQVSESVAERNLARVRALASVCKHLDFQLAVANVGARENSLQVVRLIPMHYLVIDGCFMENLEDPECRSRLEQIVAAAREKQAFTIASRVENPLALSSLFRLGIDYIVGYHVQEPEETIIDNVLLPR